MTSRVGINGSERIGRSFTRLALERADLKMIAVNDVTEAGTLAHLLAIDSAYGRLRPDGGAHAGLDHHRRGPIAVLSKRDPAAMDSGELGADMVVESTGKFPTRDGTALHLKAAPARC